MADTALPTVLQVLLTRTPDGVEAHCLPMDIVTEAPTQDQAIDDLCDLIRAQYRYGRDTNNLRAVFVPAPPEYWEKLATARSVGERNLDMAGPSEHVDDDDGDETPTYKLQELEVCHA